MFLEAAAVQRELVELEEAGGEGLVEALSQLKQRGRGAQQSSSAPDAKSGAVPAWISNKIQEVARVQDDDQEEPGVQLDESLAAKDGIVISFTLTFDEDFSQYKPGQTGDTGQNSIARLLGVPRTALVTKDAHMTVQSSLSSLSRAGEAPPGSLVLPVEVVCKGEVKPGPLLRKVQALVKHAKAGELFIGETMIYQVGQIETKEGSTD